MNTSENPSENASSDQSRPFGFWITAVDRLTAARFATAFEDEGITRRDWRILNIIDGTVPAGRELPDRKLRRLADLGWIERTADGWALTPDGTAAKARLAGAVEEIRAEVAGILGADEFTAMAASLEKLARGLGYEDGMRLPRRPGARRGDVHGRRGHRLFDDHRRHGLGHGEHRRRAGLPHGEPFGHGDPDRFAGHPSFDREWPHGEHPRFGHEHGEHPRFPGEHPRFGREHGEHPRGGHWHGMGPRGRHHRRAAEHIHIHLHHGRRDG
jgi:hypothetical protein